MIILDRTRLTGLLAIPYKHQSLRLVFILFKGYFYFIDICDIIYKVIVIHILLKLLGTDYVSRDLKGHLS